MMRDLWKQNEEKSEEEDLVVTSHRDFDEPNVTSEDEQEVQITEGEDPREALED